MKSAAEESSESLIVIARALRTRGLKGEIVAEVLTDFPERFENVRKLTAISPQGEHQVVELESYWFQNDRVILKLVGIDTIESAKQFVNYNFGIPEQERVSLPESHYYDWELEGCTVCTTAQEKLGKVTRVMRTGGVELLVVANEETGRDYLLPMAQSIICDISTEKRTIVVDPPEGLLDL
jgi:16S rRNA processing protein RimM